MSANHFPFIGSEMPPSGTQANSDNDNDFELRLEALHRKKQQYDKDRKSQDPHQAPAILTPPSFSPEDGGMPRLGPVADSVQGHQPQPMEEESSTPNLGSSSSNPEKVAPGKERKSSHRLHHRPNLINKLKGPKPPKPHKRHEKRRLDEHTDAALGLSKGGASKSRSLAPIKPPAAKERTHRDASSLAPPAPLEPRSQEQGRLSEPAKFPPTALTTASPQHENTEPAPASTTAPAPAPATAAAPSAGPPPLPPPPAPPLISLRDAAALYKEIEARVVPKKRTTELNAKVPELPRPTQVNAAVQRSKSKAQDRLHQAKERRKATEKEKKRGEILARLKIIHADEGLSQAELEKRAGQLTDNWALETEYQRKKRMEKNEKANEKDKTNDGNTVCPTPAANSSQLERLPLKPDRMVVRYSIFFTPEYTEGEDIDDRVIRDEESFIDKNKANEKAVKLLTMCRYEMISLKMPEVQDIHHSYQRDGMFFGTLVLADGRKKLLWVDQEKVQACQIDPKQYNGMVLSESFLECFGKRYDVFSITTVNVHPPLRARPAAQSQPAGEAGDQGQQDGGGSTAAAPAFVDTDDEYEEDEGDKTEDVVRFEAGFVHLPSANDFALNLFKRLTMPKPRVNAQIYWMKNVVPLTDQVKKQAEENELDWATNPLDMRLNGEPQCGHDFVRVAVIVSQAQLQGPIKLDRALVKEQAQGEAEDGDRMVVDP